MQNIHTKCKLDELHHLRLRDESHRARNPSSDLDTVAAHENTSRCGFAFIDFNRLWHKPTWHARNVFSLKCIYTNSATDPHPPHHHPAANCVSTYVANDDICSTVLLVAPMVDNKYCGVRKGKCLFIFNPVNVNNGVGRWALAATKRWRITRLD